MMLDSIASILSSYYYSYQSCFGSRDDDDMFLLIMVGFESFFILCMIKEFLTDFKVEGEKYATREFVLIAKNYLKNGFWIDFLPLIPI